MGNTLPPHFSLSHIAELVGGTCVGDGSAMVSGLAPLQKAASGQLSFLFNPRYRTYLESTKATAVLLNGAYQPVCPVSCILVKDPYAAYAKVSHLFNQAPSLPRGIHESAVVAESANLHPSVSVGPRAVIADGVTIGEGTVIGSGCVVGDDVHIGKHCRLYDNVTVYYGVSMGHEAIIHSGAVLGSDGFGFAKESGRWSKIAQNGAVRIGNGVEIGANTTVDRGAIDDTVISDGVKLDNQVQVAHNVVIGAHTVVAGCSAIAGSTTIGEHCIIGGGVAIGGHIHICDNVTLTGRSNVANHIKEPGVYSSGFPVTDHKTHRKNIMRVKYLDSYIKRLMDLEKKIAILERK